MSLAFFKNEVNRYTSNMRIVSGTYQGLHLYFQKNKHLRPTQDKVKQAVINRIRSQIHGADVLDLYSGVGSYGLEMISNNSSSITFLDTHTSFIDKNLEMICLSSLKQNLPLNFRPSPLSSDQMPKNTEDLSDLKISDLFVKTQFKLAQKKRNFSLKINKTLITRHSSTAHQFIKQTSSQYDIIFMDPPWTNLHYFDDSLKAITEFTILKPNGIIIVEHPKSVDLLSTGLSGHVYDYGNTKIGIFEHETRRLSR
jgi:16S rRNA G966 N2-methylase RsmD